jgi:hypothetical protein
MYSLAKAKGETLTWIDSGDSDLAYIDIGLDEYLDGRLRYFLVVESHANAIVARNFGLIAYLEHLFALLLNVIVNIDVLRVCDCDTYVTFLVFDWLEMRDKKEKKALVLAKNELAI